ncbi:MAG: urease accessory UreF family protein [Bacteroidales bacterium]
MTHDIIRIMRLLEFTDSTFPVGTFSFSNGLETAAQQGLVHDAATLEQYTRSAALQAAFTDGVAALHALRAAEKGDYEGVRNADLQVILLKMNAEARQMVTRMGKKMAEMAVHIIDDEMMARWLEDIRKEATPGTYPIAQAITFHACGLTAADLFCSHQYGVVNMILSAALRCVKVSHYDTQRILYKLSGYTQGDYEQVKVMSFDDMYAFAPQIDIMASLHEKGKMRMFMN